MNSITWTPAIGDPTVFGWLTVLEYFFAAWLCTRAFLAEKSGPTRPLWPSVFAWLRVVRKHAPNVPLVARRAGLWLGLCATLVAFGVNKQLDLQTLFTQIARWLIRSLGLYGVRRTLQLLFLVALFVATLVLMRWVRKFLRGYPGFVLPFWGLVVQSCFVIARATSFHAIDYSLGDRVMGLSLNFIFESAGILLIALGAALRIRQRRAERSAG